MAQAAYEQLTNALNSPSGGVTGHITMQINPEDYLPVDEYALRGPSALQAPSQPASPVAQEPATLESIQQALFAAERRGDYGQVGILSAQLDDALAAVSTAPQVAPNGAQQPSGTTSEETSTPNDKEAPEAPTEEDFHSSFFHQNLVKEVGDTDEVNALYSIINDSADQETIEAFFASAEDDGVYAGQVIDWARNVQQANAVPDTSVESAAFSEGDAEALRGASEFADDILELNRALNAGEITQQAMFMQVMQNPALMSEAVRLRDAGFISF